MLDGNTSNLQTPTPNPNPASPVQAQLLRVYRADHRSMHTALFGTFALAPLMEGMRQHFRRDRPPSLGIV